MACLPHRLARRNHHGGEPEFEQHRCAAADAVGGVMPARIHPRRKIVQGEHAGAPRADKAPRNRGRAPGRRPGGSFRAPMPHSHQRRSMALRGPPPRFRLAGAAAGMRKGWSETRKNSSCRGSSAPAPG